MAFVAEDGTGLPNSNGYITAQFFKDYHGDRGRDLTDPDTSVPYTDDKIQQAIVVASDYLDAKFTFIGMREKTTQAMEWPRVNAFYQDGRHALGVPVEVQECVAELALKQLSGEIAPDPIYDASNRLVTAERKKVGPIEKESKYTEGGAPVPFRMYPFAEARLRELIVTGQFLQRV